MLRSDGSPDGMADVKQQPAQPSGTNEARASAAASPAS